jgi:hypothetical protein
MLDHPILPAGYNADPIDGDEVDGAGTNWPLWPVMVDSFIGLAPLIVTDEMLDVFGETADIVFPYVNMTIAFPFEDTMLAVGDAWPVLVIDAESDLIMFPQQVRTQTLRDDKGEVPLTGGGPTTVIDDSIPVIRKAS